jgi:hypothetical protein
VGLSVLVCKLVQVLGPSFVSMNSGFREREAQLNGWGLFQVQECRAQLSHPAIPGCVHGGWLVLHTLQLSDFSESVCSPFLCRPR